MIKNFYLSPGIYFKNDFIGTTGHYAFYFLAGAPTPKKDFLTLVKPFDPVVWAFVLASIVAVSISLTFINKIHSTWSSESPKESPFQSIYIYIYKEKL